MDLSQLQFEINKLYDSNHKLELQDYNYLLHNTTLLKEMTATVFIYDHMLNNNIKPDHNGINEYLGELYIQTNRLDLAKGRLEVLKNCKCEEYEELKELIENN